MRRDARLGALSERPFRLLWLGQTTSAIGDALVPLALTFAVLEVGGAKGLGLSLAALMGTRAVLVLVGGVWADRLPRRLVMLGCDLLRAAVEFTTVAVIVSGNASTAFFVCTSALFGAAGAFFSPASTGLIPQVISAARLQQANALVSLSRSTVAVFGPAMSGLIVATVGAEWVFGINGVSFVISAIFLARLSVPERERGPRQAFFADLAEGWREVRSRAWVGAALDQLLDRQHRNCELLRSRPADRGGGTQRGELVGDRHDRGCDRRHPRRGDRAAVQADVPAPLVVRADRLHGDPAPRLDPPTAGRLARGVRVGHRCVDPVRGGTLEHDAANPDTRAGPSRVVAYDWLVSLVFMPIGYVAAAPLADAVGTDTTLVGLAALNASACIGILLVPSVRNMRRPGREASSACSRTSAEACAARAPA